MRFVDTNIFVRYLTGDDPVKQAACFAFFQRVQAGEEEATTREATVAEVVFVLTSRALYALSPADVQARLLPVLLLSGLRLPQKDVTLRALDLHAQQPRLDFPDALAIAHMEQAGIDQIVSYDQDFDRVPPVRRVEP